MLISRVFINKDTLFKSSSALLFSILEYLDCEMFDKLLNFATNNEEMTKTRIESRMFYFSITLSELVQQVNLMNDEYFFIKNKKFNKKFNISINFENKDTILKSLNENGIIVENKMIEIDFFEFKLK